MLIGLAMGASAQTGDESPDDKPPPTQEIVQKAWTLLRDVTPRSGPPGVPYAHQPDQPCQQMELEGGTVRWGNLFVPTETVALVSLAPRPKTEDDWYDARPRYLCFFAWKRGQWMFRQLLGNVYDLTLHHRRDQPAAFLQGSCRTGRYEGDHLSWYYDPASGRLVPTHFEDWGPFYLVGNHLVLGRGFERLAHDDTHWIYAYKNGRKGKLLAIMHTNDSGRFDIGCRDARSGKWRCWHFKPESEEGDALSVTVEDDPKGNRADGGIQDENAPTARLTGAEANEYFGFLTGLNPALLDDKWLDEPPKWSAPGRLPIKATGSRAVAARFQ